MKSRWKLRLRRRAMIAVALATAAVAVLPALPGSAAVRPIVNKITAGVGSGFGDSANDYAWSMAWFNGKLYVGTSRNEQCVENATLDFYFPGKGYYPPKSTGVVCPPNAYDMDLRAQIWQYTPSTKSWLMVYQSPNIPNPADPTAQYNGGMIARDIGYRGMVVYNNALYIGANTANEYDPALTSNGNTNPPVLLRTTDGSTFTPVDGAPGNIDDPSGNETAMGYRAMQVLNGRLFVTVIHALTGDGVVEEVTNPDSTATFTQISPSTMQVFELQTFNGWLYAGTGSGQTGYGVYKTQATSVPATFTPVVTGGAGRGAGITSVVSMGVFQNKLYVGASGWYKTALPASELIRIGAGGAWDVVAGVPRNTAQGYKAPISGLTDGFGNPFNAHFWRQTARAGGYYVGTNDWSYAWNGFPVLGDLLKPGFGFDIWGTCDGKYWWTETKNAFGAGMNNFGARTMAATPYGLAVGSADHVDGTSVFMDYTVRHCQPAVKAKAIANSSLAQSTVSGPPNPPVGLTATTATTGPGTKLSWVAPDGGAKSYVVLRADYVTSNNIDVVKPPTVDGQSVLTMPDPTTAQTTAPVSVPLAFTQIGTSKTTAFTDTSAVSGASYLYEVVAVSGSGLQSVASNVTGAPLS